MSTVPPVESFLSQLHALHYGTSRIAKKKILPDELLNLICKPLAALYPTITRDTFRAYLETSYHAVNAFRDSIPPEAFETYEPSLLTRLQSCDLNYLSFGNVFRTSQFKGVFYPPYYQDFSEAEPAFFREEPYDAEEKVDWRNDKRYFETFEYAPWKERKRHYEKKQKEFARKLDPVEDALLGTPFYPLWQTFERQYAYRVPFRIPEQFRFGHQFLVGASRSGKTTFLTAQLLDDLKNVERGTCSVIVMDSQNEFVPNISKLALFGKGQPLEGKLIYLEPNAYPIASNIFSGDFRANYDNAWFFLDSIFKSDVSSQQTTVLRYVIQALAVIPNATVATLKELMEDDGYAKYQEHFDKLDPFVHNWIRDKLHPKNKDFAVSRVAIRNRLDGFLADPFFRAMFSDPYNKLDLFEELKTPKVILINTADLGGALEPFGRYIIAKLDEAMQKRKNTPRKLPVFCYIDEASDYIADEPIVAKIIDKVGKQKLGLIISIQRKAFIVSANVLDALEHVAIQAWTIKPPVATVALVGEEPVSLQVPLINLAQQPHMRDSEYEALRAGMKRKFASDPRKPSEEVQKKEAPPETKGPSGPDNVKPDAPDWEK